MKKIWRKALAFMLVVAINVSAINVPVHAQENVIKENAVIDEMVSGDGTDKPIIETENEGWDQITTEKIYKSENFNVLFTLTSYWDTGYNAIIKLENTGNIPIQNWYLRFDYNNVITNIWNAEVSETKENAYLIKNVGWNQDIAVNNSIEFGISGNHAFKGFPENYELISTSTEIAENDYTIEYHVDNNWETGFYGTISVTNNTDCVLEDWVLEFDFDREITEIWDGIIETHEGNHYVIRNAEYNSSIASGQTVSIGIKGCKGSIDDEPENYTLISYSDYEEKNNLEIDLNLDSDNDGAEDYIEEYFGTDKSKLDTDEDGLSDFVELFALVLDPLNVDTDGNGVVDGDEDLDGDGLSNIIETQVGTSILKQDTDEDGLTDFQEYNQYGTNPTLEDSDSDGASDGKEIQLGTNPLVYDNTFSMSVTAEGEDTVKASVEMAVSGDQVESLTVEQYKNDFFFPTNMPGYIGGAYDFSIDGSFSTATIKFEFDEALLSDISFDPVIYYFNEETQLLEELPTALSGNVAYTQVSHFSKYILLNRKVFQNAFEWQDVWSSTGYTGVEVVLVIDDSGSMSSSDRTNQRLTVAKNLIDNLPQNSKVGVVRFTSGTYKLTSSITDDKEVAKSYLTTGYFRSSGGTYMYNAINSTFSLFESTDDKIMKMMVVLSDGATSDTRMHTSTITTANDKGVKIYTVGLGSSSSNYFTSYLKPLANNTGGAFYLASDASQLEDIYDDINKKIDIETDSDEDGIADYYEENMVMFNGVTIKLEKNNPDSDGDELLDGEEVAELNYQYNNDKTQVIVTGKLNSNPLDVDSDNDEISDEEEVTIGTDPKAPDTDHDGLIDGFEYTYGYDPLQRDFDGDGRSDWREYQEDTDPYTYNKEWNEHVWDFVKGFIAGDFIEDTDSLPLAMGQITSSLIPYVDVRDIVGNLVHGNYGFAGINAIGLFPAAGDAVATTAKVGKFVVKNIDDVPKIANLLEFLNKNFPDVVNLLNKSDDFIAAAKQLSKADNIKLTRKQAKALTETFEEAGLSEYLLKTSNTHDVLNWKDSVNIGSEVWEDGAITRGNKFDDLVNGHVSGTPLFSGESLGKNFPVFDRLMENEGIIISTKSLDIAAQSYQNPNTLKNALNKYAESAKKFEKKYMKSDGSMKWVQVKLKETQYNTKVLEIILPDVIITEDTLKVLREFQESMPKGMEVWYRIGK